MIDLDCTDPDWKLAEVHAFSTKAGKSSQSITDI